MPASVLIVEKRYLHQLLHARILLTEQPLVQAGRCPHLPETLCLRLPMAPGTCRFPPS